MTIASLIKAELLTAASVTRMQATGLSDADIIAMAERWAVHLSALQEQWDWQAAEFRYDAHWDEMESARYLRAYLAREAWVESLCHGTYQVAMAMRHHLTHCEWLKVAHRFNH